MTNAYGVPIEEMGGQPSAKFVAQGRRKLLRHLSQRAHSIAIDLTAQRIRAAGLQEIFHSMQAIKHIRA